MRRDQIDAVFAEGGDLAGAIEKVARLGAQLLLQSALEAEVTDFLGRGRYARSALTDEARPGMRNGYCDTTVKTTAGPVTLKRPKLRGTDERFCSKLFGKHVTKTNTLEVLVIGSYVRGLSDRDVENALTEALGAEASVPRSTVSRICGQIRDQFDAWRCRDLSTIELDYLFLDASFFRYHVGAAAEPIVAAWGIDTAGKPVFIGLDTASGESADAWTAFLTGLGERGLDCPLMVISDGAKGLISAVEQAMPKALRQRCLIHRSRNLLAKVPDNARAEVKDDYWAIFDIPEGMEPGLDTVAFVQKRIDAFAARWRNSYPSAVRCILDDRASLTEYLRMPREHWAGSGTRTSSSARSARPEGASRLSAGYPANTPASRWCGPYSTGPPRAGAAWRSPPTGNASSPGSAARCSPRRPSYPQPIANPTRHQQKRTLSEPSHNIKTEQDPRPHLHPE